MDKFILNQLNKNDKLLKHGLLVLIFSFLTHILNYVFQLYMGRALGPEQYGVFGALMSLFYILSAPASSINTVLTKFVSNYKSHEEYGKIKTLLIRSFRKLLIYGVIGFIIYLLISSFIAGFLRIETYYVIIIGILVLLTFLVQISNGFLRGLQKFTWMNVNGLLWTSLKLIFGIIFVSLGLGVLGALIALNLSVLIGILFPFIALAFLFKYRKENITNDKSMLYSYGWFLFLGSMFLVMLVNGDVILVKRFFNDSEVGIYNAVSTIAKIIWFSSGALITVMFPKVNESFKKGENPSSILRTSLFYVFLIAVALIVLSFVAPTFIVNTLYGNAYLDAVKLLGLFSVGLGLFSLSNVLMFYNFGIEKKSFIYAIFGAFVFEAVLISLFHSTLIEVVKIVVGVNLLLFLFFIFYTREAFGIKNGLTI